jgi:hypothetical protein
VNQHPHWYLHLLEFGILVAIFNPGNDKIELRNLDLVWCHIFLLHTRDIRALVWYLNFIHTIVEMSLNKE